MVDTQLNPEKGLSYELGIRHSPPGNKVQWSIVLFRNEIDDLIQYVGHPPLYLGQENTIMRIHLILITSRVRQLRVSNFLSTTVYTIGLD